MEIRQLQPSGSLASPAASADHSATIAPKARVNLDYLA